MLETKDYKNIRKRVLDLPREKRRALLEDLLLTFSPEKSYRQPTVKPAKQQDIYAQMIGLLATEEPLSDEDIEQILYEEKLKQHGLGNRRRF